MFFESTGSFERFVTEFAGVGLLWIIFSDCSSHFVVIFLGVLILFGLVPPPVGGQIGGTIEDFVTLRASVFHMNDHGASAKKKESAVDMSSSFAYLTLLLDNDVLLSLIAFL